MKQNTLITLALVFLIGCQPNSVSVLDFEFDRSVLIYDVNAMTKLEQLFVQNGINHNKRSDGYLQYSTRDLAQVRKIERIANPPPDDFCCVELEMSSEKSMYFAGLLDSSGITYRKIKTIQGDENIAWERKDENLVDSIVQELEIKCIEEFKQAHKYCS